MRFSPTKLLQGLLCSTPILVLALAACGGGGGGGGSSGTPAAAYTLGGAHHSCQLVPVSCCATMAAITCPSVLPPRVMSLPLQ